MCLWTLVALAKWLRLCYAFLIARVPDHILFKPRVIYSGTLFGKYINTSNSLVGTNEIFRFPNVIPLWIIYG
jgi:hypothetical protein